MHYPDLGSASDWLCREGISQPIRSTTKNWVVHVISMEFLRSLLRRRFARAQVATSRNVGCFLKPSNLTMTTINRLGVWRWGRKWVQITPVCSSGLLRGRYLTTTLVTSHSSINVTLTSLEPHQAQARSWGFIHYCSTYHPALQYTFNISEASLSFLDLCLSISDKISTSIHDKPTDTHSYLQYGSDETDFEEKSAKWEHSLQGGDINRGSLPPVRERLRTLAATRHSERHVDKRQVTPTYYDS